MSDPIEVSVIVPVYNEAGSLEILDAEIHAAMAPFQSGGRGYEVIYVDDCSRDESLRIMLELRRRSPHVRIVKFRRNYGQTPALAAGFDVSRGSVVVTLDGDL